jgi:hypothetical protein
VHLVALNTAYLKNIVHAVNTLLLLLLYACMWLRCSDIKLLSVVNAAVLPLILSNSVSWLIASEVQQHTTAVQSACSLLVSA